MCFQQHDLGSGESKRNYRFGPKKDDLLIRVWEITVTGKSDIFERDALFEYTGGEKNGKKMFCDYVHNIVFFYRL